MNTDKLPIRLKHFMESRGLSNSQFADTCGIARPTLSQILSGRNKKVSDVLISQIHEAFPDLSVMWLLFGEGEMYHNSPSPETFDPEIGGDSQISFVGNEISDFDGGGFDTHLSNTAVGADFPMVTVESRATKVSKNDKPEVNQSRQISHITVYYDDRTFETFYPKN